MGITTELREVVRSHCGVRGPAVSRIFRRVFWLTSHTSRHYPPLRAPIEEPFLFAWHCKGSERGEYKIGEMRWFCHRTFPWHRFYKRSVNSLDHHNAAVGRSDPHSNQQTLRVSYSQGKNTVYDFHLPRTRGLGFSSAMRSGGVIYRSAPIEGNGHCKAGGPYVLAAHHSHRRGMKAHRLSIASDFLGSPWLYSTTCWRRVDDGTTVVA